MHKEIKKCYIFIICGCESLKESRDKITSFYLLIKSMIRRPSEALPDMFPKKLIPLGG